MSLLKNFDNFVYGLVNKTKTIKEERKAKRDKEISLQIAGLQLQLDKEARERVAKANYSSYLTVSGVIDERMLERIPEAPAANPTWTSSRRIYTTPYGASLNGHKIRPRENSSEQDTKKEEKKKKKKDTRNINFRKL